MNKKIMAIVAVIALVAILGICLVACNADSYTKKLEKAGYNVATASEDDVDKYLGKDADVEWAVIGQSGLDIVLVAKLADKDAAEDIVNNVKLFKADNSGSIVFIATTQTALDAAK